MCAIVYYKHDNMLTLFHFKEILFIPCTKKKVVKTYVETLSICVSQCVTCIYMMYPLVRLHGSPVQNCWNKWCPGSDTALPHVWFLHSGKHLPNKSVSLPIQPEYLITLLWKPLTSKSDTLWNRDQKVTYISCHSGIGIISWHAAPTL